MALLNGWKEIARYLGHGVRTVQRYEELGLPVRRPNGNTHSNVIALTEELDAWVHRAPTREESENRVLKQRVAELEAEVAALRAELQNRQETRMKVAAGSKVA